MMNYGETGVGKTTCTLQSAPDPVMYIQTEPRSLQPSMDAANRPELDIDVAIYKNWSDLMAFVASAENFKRHKTLVVDSYSHLMNISLSSEISDEAFESRSEKERQNKPLVMQSKLSMEGFGGLSANMFRLTSALGRLSQNGKIFK